MNQEIWTPEEQAAFADFMKKQFPNELDSFATMSLGSAWKDGQAHPTPPQPDHSAQPEYPAGAIENGRAFFEMLDLNYGFKDSHGHPLQNCLEYTEARRCFEYLAGNAQPLNTVQGDAQAVACATIHVVREQGRPPSASVVRFDIDQMPVGSQTNVYTHADAGKIDILKANAKAAHELSQSLSSLVATLRVQLETTKTLLRDINDAPGGSQFRLAIEDILSGSAELAKPEASVMPDRLQKVLKFLDGSENLDGHWFGEPHPTGRLWWRAELRKALEETNLFAKP